MHDFDQSCVEHYVFRPFQIGIPFGVHGDYVSAGPKNPVGQRQQVAVVVVRLTVADVGPTVQLWRSPDLVDLEYLGTPYTLDDGDVRIRAVDPRYGTPGPDEVQQFD